ncbi:MAG: Mrp/NBP35 family ATP-binding protein [Odoribacter sp.]|nr:Mrp/NBP35 family ATP-binding protein [Odoribacter sp.]
MMQTLYPKLILDALERVKYPGHTENIVAEGFVEDDMRIDGDSVSFSLIFDRTTDPFVKSLVKAAESAIHAFVDPAVKVDISVKARPAAKIPVAPPALPGVKNIVAVSSGKGGVGKSTVAANLAVALAAEGYKVGLLDADIFGPSVPRMFGIENEQLYMHNVEGRDLIIPVERYGVKLLSIGLVIDPSKAALWRGSMASNALKQLIEQADWGDLDYFLIDMPPGTSDIHLTLVQTLGITGALVVTTPQEVALADARKGIAMFREPKINVPVLGIVDNMAWFTPAPHPEERYYIFGNDASVDRVASEFDVPMLARIPLIAEVGDHNDAGLPIVADAHGVASPAFMHLAHVVVEAVDERNDNLPPTVKVSVK